MRSIRSICLYTVIACFFLFFPAITFAQEAGDISALGYVEGEVGTEYCPDDLLSVKAVVTVNNTSDEQLSFFYVLRLRERGKHTSMKLRSIPVTLASFVASIPPPLLMLIQPQLKFPFIGSIVADQTSRCSGF